MSTYHNPLHLFLCTAVIMVIWFLILVAPMFALMLINTPTPLIQLICAVWMAGALFCLLCMRIPVL